MCEECGKAILQAALPCSPPEIQSWITLVWLQPGILLRPTSIQVRSQNRVGNGFTEKGKTKSQQRFCEQRSNAGKAFSQPQMISPTQKHIHTGEKPNVSVECGKVI